MAGQGLYGSKVAISANLASKSFCIPDLQILLQTLSYRVVLQATLTHERGYDRDGEAIMISLHTQENLIEFDQQVLVSLLRLFHAQFGQDDDVNLDESL